MDQLVSEMRATTAVFGKLLDQKAEKLGSEINATALDIRKEIKDLHGVSFEFFSLGEATSATTFAEPIE